jgi:hypothetical protein
MDLQVFKRWGKFFSRTFHGMEINVDIFSLKRKIMQNSSQEPLNSLAPHYITELLHPYKPTRNLRSSTRNNLIIPRSNLISYDDRSFSTAAPKLWNTLPLSLKEAKSIDIFKSELKTFLFTS